MASRLPGFVKEGRSSRVRERGGYSRCEPTAGASRSDSVPESGRLRNPNEWLQVPRTESLHEPAASIEGRWR